MSIIVTTLYDNRLANPLLKEGWGFSVWIEHGDNNILFDTGADHAAFSANRDKLQVRLEETTHLFFSHRHGDHTAGFTEVVDQVAPTTLLVVPRGFPRALLKKSSLTTRVVVGLTEVAENLYSMVLRGGAFLYEQSLILRGSEGLYLFTGCAHPGIVAILRAAQEQLRAPIQFVMGGFHFFRQSTARCQELVEQFRQLGVHQVAPCHCSGARLIGQFHDAYNENFFQVGTGAILNL